MEELGQLEKAKAGTKRKVNKLWTSNLLMPGNDPKNNLCEHLNFIDITSPSGRYKGMYRIMPTETTKDMTTDTINYRCEHVLATLMDDVMEGHHVFTEMTTRQVLQAILDLQTVRHWVLGIVEFDNYPNYAFEDENTLLGPIFEVPKVFNEEYEFTFDTTVYPFVLNLMKVSNEVVGEKRWGRDLGSFRKISDPTNIINYIVPKGEGEGVNKLTIEDVNDGKKYLLDQASIDVWGKKSQIWIDQRFENKETLKARGQAILNQRKDPKISFSTTMYDISIKDEYAGTESILNGLIEIVVEEHDDHVYLGRILEEDIPDLAREYEVNYEIANRMENAASDYVDLSRQLDVNTRYSVGATNIDSVPGGGNCDPLYPAVIEFPIPKDMINVNESILRIRTNLFRGYVRGMKNAGQYIKSSVVQSESTEDGGAFIKSNVVQSTSTEDGGGAILTTPAGGNHYHRLFVDAGESTAVFQRHRFSAYAKEQGYAPSIMLETSNPGSIYTFEADGDHEHTVYQQAHRHTITITIPGFNIPSHKHLFKVTIPEINIPGHVHENEYGIYEHPDLPTELTIKVDGTPVSFYGIEGEINITDYLRKDGAGKVTRDYHKIEVFPNDLAMVNMIVSNRFFVRSHQGVTV